MRVSQYRPVSNLSFVSKLVEKSGNTQLNNYLSRHNLHSHHQSAYKENFSTETALCYLVNHLLWNFEHGKVSVMVSLDLSSAFDTVEHSTLCSVLDNNFGVRQTSLQWISSYLKDRKMTVAIGDSVSSTRTFNFSVPQGSCLGPLLFNMYSSTISECVQPEQDLGGYADDHFVRDCFDPTVAGDESACHKRLEKTLVDIQNWMQANTLKMNANKTDVSLFGSKLMLSKAHINSICVGEEDVAVSDGIKYLGVWMDSNLSMKHHIDKKIKTAAGNIRRIISIRPFIDTDTAKILATSLVLSHLDYANSILSGLPKSTIAKLQRIQNWAAKVVLCSRKYDSSSNALKVLHWLPIKSRVDFQVLCLIYRCLNNMAPSYLSDLLQIQQSSRTTRSSTSPAVSLVVPCT
jgi:hypothetical protein